MKIYDFKKSSISNTLDCKSTYHLFIIAFSITMVGLFIEIGNTIPMHLIQAQISANPEQQNPQDNNVGQQNQQNVAPEQQNPQDNSFIVSGPLNSFIRTPVSDWVVNGNWSLKVQNGKLISFDGQMRWDPTNLTKNTTISHTHSFSNFIEQPTNPPISLNPLHIMDIKGTMDVGANLKKDNWKDVPAEIKTAGQTITITLDDLKTGHHFNNYPIFGKINTISKINTIKNINNATKQINVKIGFNENPIARGKIQTFTLVASDLSSNNTISGLNINSTILPPSEIKKINAINLTNSIFTDKSIKKIQSFSGTTDSNGQFSYSWKLNKKFKPGTITVVTQISGLGYQPITKATTFIETKR